MPKIYFNNGAEPLQISTFKIEPSGVVYQIAPIGSAMPHSSMGFIKMDIIDIIEHDEQLIEEVDVTDDLVQG